MNAGAARRFTMKAPRNVERRLRHVPIGVPLR
jgi:hypothetical protein